jgi:hypothetical protein
VSETGWDKQKNQQEIIYFYFFISRFAHFWRRFKVQIKSDKKRRRRRIIWIIFPFLFILFPFFRPFLHRFLRIERTTVAGGPLKRINKNKNGGFSLFIIFRLKNPFRFFLIFRLKIPFVVFFLNFSLKNSTCRFFRLKIHFSII